MTGRRVITGLGLAVLVLLGWMLLAPQQLGGPLTVVSTYGDSMVPTYTASDLVVVVEAGDYDVGDIVAYRSPELGAVILHRIVDVDDDGYVTSGDNNDWLDPDRPTDDDLMGTARLRVPGAGRLLEVPVPLRAAAVTGLAAFALFGSRRRGRRDRRGRRPGTGGTLALRGHGRPAPDDRLSDGGDSVASDTAGSPLTWTGWPGTVAAVGVALALAGTALGVVAQTTPSVAPGEVSYTHEGTFDYTTPAPGGLVYPDGEVATGDPVFLRLVDTLDLTFTHELDAPTQDVHTVGRLWLELADGSGWSHRSPLNDEQEATGEPLVLGAPLDVPAVRELIGEIREEAGVEAGGGGRIDVTAEVEVTATVEGEELSDTFSPTLGFELSGQRLAPQVGEDEDDAFTSTQERTVTVADAEPARLEVAGRGLDVDDARVLAAVALVLGLLAVVVGLAGALRHRGLDEAERLRLRYHSRLLEVDSLRAPANHGLVTVRDMPTLVALAERAERPILHHEQHGLHTYVVEDETTQYHYRVEVTSPTPSTAEESDEDADQATSSAPANEEVIPVPETRPQPGPEPRPDPVPGPEPRPGPLPDPEPEPQPGPLPDPEPSPEPDPQPGPVPEPEPRPGPIPDPEPGPRPEPQLEAEAWWDEIDDAQVPSDEPLFSSSAPAADRPAARDAGPWVARPPRRSAAPTTPPPGASESEDTSELDGSTASEHRNRPRARRSKRLGENGLFRRRDDDEQPANRRPDSP